MLPLAFAASIFAQTIPPLPDIQRRVDAIFQEFDKPGSPGCVIGVARKGASLYWRGYGYDNEPPHRPLDPDTVFEVGPLSTSLIWSAFAELAKQHRLGFDESIRLRIPELPEYAVPIKIRDLLEGRSEFRSYGELFALALHDSNVEQDDARVFEMIVRQKHLATEQPSDDAMSDTEYFLLSKIVERTVGIPLSRLIQEKSFWPASMRNTTIGAPREGVDSGKKRFMVFTTLRDLASWNERFPNYAFEAVERNRLEPGWYPLAPGTLIALCNSPTARPSELARSVISLMLPPSRSQQGAPLLLRGGVLRGIRTGVPSAPPPEYLGRVTGRFHSSELDMDLVLDDGVLKLVRPDGTLVTHREVWDQGLGRWASTSVRFLREGKEVTAIIVGSGYSIRDIRFEKVP